MLLIAAIPFAAIVIAGVVFVILQSLYPPDSAAGGATTLHIPSLNDTPSATPQNADPTPGGVTTETPTPPAETPSETCTDAAAYVTDVTISDGTIIAPGESFTKTWRLRNTGTCTWTSGYALVFAGGESMSGPSSQALPGEVPPGGEIDLSVALVAPAEGGTYRSEWLLQSADGARFGVGQDGETPIWAEIVVRTGETPTPTITASATTAPAPAISAWRGDYFGTVDLTGAPILVRDDAAVDFNWAEAAPDSRLPVDGFSVRWTRTLDFEADTYRFRVGADDGVRMWVDDQIIIDEWRDSPFHEVTVDRAMTRGPHTLRVDYYERVGLAQARVSWEQIVPGSDPMGADATAASVSFALPPIVQQVSGNGAVITFELDSPAEGALLYRTVGGPIQASAFSSDRTYHQITLTGLSPATPYEYAVRIGAGSDYRQPFFSGAPWGTGAFRTPPYGPPIRIGVIGDSGYGDPVTAALVNRMAALRLDFVIHTGDVVYEMAEDASPVAAFARKFFTPFGPVLRQGPIYPVVGNHDLDPETYWQGMPMYYYVFPPEPYGSEGARRWYTVAVGDVQFVFLDTQAYFGEGRRSAQEAWLAERLADSRFADTIVVFHVPPHTSGMHYNDGRTVETAWASILQEAGVALVLCGHEHFYEHLVVDGIDYVTSGGGSANLYALGVPYPGSRIVSRTSHFTLLEIYPDRMALQAIDLNGAVIDEFSIPRD